MRRVSGCLLLLALATVSFHASAQSVAPSEEKVRELLLVTGAEALGLQVMDAMMGDFSNIYPNVPESFWKELRAEIKPDELTVLMIPVYQKHLTVEEVDELIRFFSTPVGRSFVTKQHSIMADSMEVGAAWGEKLAERVLERLESRGLTE